MLGAIDAGLSGNDSLSAAIAAGGAEAATPIIAQALYGTANPSKLTVKQKNDIAALSGIIGAAAGASTGNVNDVAMGNVAGSRAVEHNYLTYKESVEKERLLNSIRECSVNPTCQPEKDMANEIEQLEEIWRIDEERENQVAESCQDRSSPSCANAIREMDSAHREYIKSNDYFDSKLTDENAKDLGNLNSTLARTGFNHKYPEWEKAVGGGISLGADFTPVIGDIKGFYEAETIGDYIFAAVGVIPVVGDAAKKAHEAEKAYKAAKAAEDVAGMKSAMKEANEVIGEVQSVSRVRPVNGRMPINSKYAGRTIPLEDLPLNIRNKYPHSVTFNGAGFPDFSRYTIRNIRIELGNSRRVDARRADAAAGYNRNNPRPSGYTWHHHQDAGYMQLVPEDLHDV